MSDELPCTCSSIDLTTAISCPIHSTATYNRVLHEYLDLYFHQPPRQAELIIPAWALERLNALPPEQRTGILAEIDQVAAQDGLLTPTKIIVAVHR